MDAWPIIEPLLQRTIADVEVDLTKYLAVGQLRDVRNVKEMAASD